jgi:helix-turn-helix protein
VLVTVTIVFGGSGTCNETRWEIGDTVFELTAFTVFELTAFTVFEFTAFTVFVELTAIGIVRVDEALEKGYLGI